MKGKTLQKIINTPKAGLKELPSLPDNEEFNVEIISKDSGKVYTVSTDALGSGEGGGGSSYIPPFLKTGGASWSGTGLVYDVTALEYYFNGDKTTSATQVTLDASDPVNNRLDAIVVDEAGVVSVIKGDASASPISPSVDESHILVQYILVEAGSTQPTIAKEDIYLENAEWTTSTYTTGAATGAIDFDNAVSPKQGVKCISANADARLGARFVRTTSFDPYQYTMLSMWVRFTGSNVATNKSLNVRFENGAGALVANTINLFNFGLQRNLLNVWQLVVIPITSFGALPTSVKGLKIIMTGGTVGQARQWDIDLISLTDNSVPAINEQVFNVLKDGALVGQSSSLNFKGGSVNVTKDVTGDKIDVEVIGSGGIESIVAGTNITVDNTDPQNPIISATGGGSPITIGTSGDTLYSSGFSNTGQGDTTIGKNIFLGDFAGGLSDSVSYSNLFGYAAGYGISDSVQNMNVFGRQAGHQANNSANSNFIGGFAGAQSTNSANSNFIGADAGNNADQSFGTNFIGSGAGSQSKNSAFSNFIGFLSGSDMSSSYGNDSIFIGTSAGAGDSLSNYGEISYSSLSGTFTVGEGVSSSSGGSAYIMFDNGTDLRVANVQGDFNINDTITGYDSGTTANLDYFSTSKASILIGNNTSTGDYYNSIAIGNGATNTANNEIVIESTKGLENLKLKLNHTTQSAVTFTGSGLDNLTLFVNVFSGTYPTTYTVTVDGLNKDVLLVTTSSISGGSFAVGNTITNGLGASATIDAISTLPSDDKTAFVISSITGTFNNGDTIDNGSGVTGTQNGSVTTRDTITWTDGTTTVNNTIAVDSNGVVAGFSAPTGHTLTDEWTWDYTTVNQNVLDFSNNDYKFGATIGTDTFGYQISDNLFGFGLLGSLATYQSGSDIGLSGFWKPGGTLTLESSLMLAGGQSGFRSSNNVVTVGNLASGNNTKITIDDVNEHITISNLPAYDDDTAAGVGGLTAGMVYMTTGSGSAPLNAAGILMIKQ